MHRRQVVSFHAIGKKKRPRAELIFKQIMQNLRRFRRLLSVQFAGEAFLE